MTTSSTMKENADAAAAANRIKTATLNAAKGLSRAQAERAVAAAARNVNAYGQKEEGPSRWQERKEAKRQMYLMSTEKAVKLGVRKDHKPAFDRVGSVMSQQCQKCLKIGHWTFDCKNERAYVSRPSRTQQLKNPKLRQLVTEPSTSLSRVCPEEIPEAILAGIETHVRKSDMRTRKRRRSKASDSDSDESESPPDSVSISSEPSSCTKTSSGTYSSSTHSTPSRTSSSSRKSTSSSISITTPPDSNEETTHPRPCPRSKDEYRGLTTEGARRKVRMKLRKAIKKAELRRRKRKRKESRKK